MADTISVRGLRVTAGTTVLLDDIEFDVHPGEILILFGPSGAGKTTIADTLVGTVRPGLTVTGEIRRGAAVRVGYLPQNAAATLNPARRIGAALGELVDLQHRRNTGRRAGGLRRELSAVALNSAAFDVDTGLDRLLGKFPHQFSGGERTRLALAQVMAFEPDVLVVDEPTVGLDPLARATLSTQLARLRSDGKSIVLITHDPRVAEQLGDRTLFVREGRLVEASAAVPRDPSPPSVAERSAPILKLQDITVSPALRDVRLELDRGEFLGLVGRSGAGKSTLGRCIAGLNSPDSGAVLLDGKPMPALRQRSRAQIAAIQYVWQESASAFDPRRTVLDQVAATGQRLRGLERAHARAEALAMLAELSLEPHQVRRHPPGLSGGQLQRAALARALMASPRILVCDEITTALDRPLAQRIQEYLVEYRRRTGAAVLFISHDLTDQLTYADRIAVLDNGRIIEQGTPNALGTQPKTTLLRRFLQAENITW